MAKIGILTFHRSINYGAFMQAYTLATRLSDELPNDDVEIIDYVTEATMDNYSDSWNRKFRCITGIKGKMKFIIKTVLDSSQMRRQKELNNAFGQAYQHMLLSKETLVTDDMEKATRWLKGRYDIIIVGSDCVWETFGYPFPNLYFLNGLDNVIKMSYAATLDRLYYPTVCEEKRQYMKEALSKFSYRGVRDYSTEMFLNCCGLDHYHNCDPTLLLDINKVPANMNRIKIMFQQAGISPGDKIIGMMGSNQYCKFIRKKFGKEYKIVSLYAKCEDSDLYLGNLTPLEWAKVFSMFSVTVSVLFHGSLLSLVNSVPTIAIDNWYSCSNEHITKIEDVYNRMNLREHYFKGGEKLSEDTKRKICEKLDFFTNYPDINAIKEGINSERKSFDLFLNELKNQIKTLG